MAISDAIVIGGGIIGCSIAYRLAQEKVKVTVVERNARPGSEASAAAAGMLIAEGHPHPSKALSELARASRELYPELVRRLKSETGIDIEHRRSGLIFLAFSDEDEAELDRLYARQKEEGIQVERLSSTELLALEPKVSRKARWGLRFQAEQYVDNLKLVEALVVAAARLGVEFRTGAPVTALSVEKGKAVGVEVSGEKLQAACVINAAGCWAGTIDGKFSRLPVKPARGQIVLIEALAPLFNHLLFSRRAYIAPRCDGRMLVGSTIEFAGFDRSVTAGGVASILGSALEISPDLGRLPIRRALAGLRPFAPDELPILGPSEIEGLIIATGHYRNGILLAPITAKLITKLVIEGAMPAELDRFSPRRFS